MFKDKVDPNDLNFIKERGYMPCGWVPCPRGEGGKINPQVTQFKLDETKSVSVFHNKPVYYETVNYTWRPLEEVCEHHGNRKIILNELALERMHPRFMAWLQKRQQLIEGGICAFNTVLPEEISVRIERYLEEPVYV